MAHIPIADERVGVQVKLWNPLRTRAIPERFWGVFHYRALYQVYVPLPLPL